MGNIVLQSEEPCCPLGIIY